MVETRSAGAPVGVLHLIESDGLYGAEQVVLALATQTVAGSGFSAAIACLVKDPAQPHALHDRARSLGIPAFKLTLRNATWPVDLLRLMRSVRRRRVGLIHAHGYKAEIIAYAMNRVYGIPILVTCHLWFEESQSRWTYRMLSRLERRLYPRFPHVVAVSPQIAEQLRRWGVRPERLTEISNGITLEAAPGPAAAEALRRRLGLDATATIVVNVGRLAEQKAQSDLIEAARILRSAHPQLRTLILGDGQLRASLDDQIARAGLGDVVRILGFQDNVREYLSVADIFALPSVDEGLPVALLEALAAGVAVVCTPVGAIPNVLEHEQSALFVAVHSPAALAEALARLVTRPDLRRDLAQRGQDVVKRRFTSETMYRRYHDLYAALSAGPPQHAGAPGRIRGA